MFRTMANAWKIPDLRKKLLFTLFIVLIYRIGACLPVPFVSTSQFSADGLMGIMNIFSGGALDSATLFALGVSPYITASIVIQLLTVAIPPLEKLAKRGEEGKNKIAQITRYITIAIAIITGIGYYMVLLGENAITTADDPNWLFYAFVIVACFVAGSSIVMWLAEKINERGIGNGISIILFANIISRMPTKIVSGVINIVESVKNYIANDQGEATGKYLGDMIFHIVYLICYILLLLVLTWFIIYITDSERRIPIQYAKKVVGRKMYGGQSSNLPIKLNMTGVMPLIFANAILSLPATIGSFFGIQAPTEWTGSFWHKFLYLFSNQSWLYVAIQLVLIIAFAYFYVAISFNPTEVSGNIQKNGGAIPGIRPGKATSDFISKVLSRITLLGAIFLAIISVIPLMITIILSYIPALGQTTMLEYNPILEQLGLGYGHTYISMIRELAFLGTSVIIVVGVVLETVRDMEAQMSMRHYKGFLE